MDGGFRFFDACELAGGLALFLYGMGLAVEGLRRVAGHGLRRLLTLLTGRPALGAVAGAAVTVGLQSSSATTVMLVGLAEVGVVTLRQSVGVIVGAAVGTTLTVQILAFDVARYGLLALVVGLLVQAVGRRESHRAFGRLLLGFGFVFYGMHLMKSGAAPLAADAGFAAALQDVADHPLLGVLAAALFTTVVQSSAATLAVAMAITAGAAGGDALAAARTAVPLVIGANIGTCATALLASASTSRRGKQVAAAHLAIKLIGAAVVLALLAPYARAVTAGTQWLSGEATPARLIANAHTLFALVAAAVVLPVAGRLARGIARLLPAETGAEFSALGEGLRQEWLQTPPRALDEARREAAHCARALREMFRLAGRALFEEDEAALIAARRGDARVDLSVEAVSDYLLRLDAEALAPAEARRCGALLRVARELEFCGDVISREMAALVDKFLALGTDLSIEGAAHLRRFWSEVAQGFSPLISVLETGRRSAADEAAEGDRAVAEAFEALHRGHIERLRKGLAAERRTAEVYLDLALAARRVHAHLAEAARRSAGEEAAVGGEQSG